MAKNKVTLVEEFIAEVGKESAEVGQEQSIGSVEDEEPLLQGDEVQPNASKGEDQRGVSHPSTGSARPKKTDSGSGQGQGPEEDDEFFHAMISYRVATQGDAGDAFSTHLYKEMRSLSKTEPYKLPESLCGEWPSSAQPPEGYVRGQKIFKVYLDKFCLKGGERWDIGDDGKGGFMGGVLKSLVFVPLLSWEMKKKEPEGKLVNAGSVGNLMGIDAKTTFVDNVLLEWIVALKLHEKKIGKIRSIFPVFMGDGKDKHGRYNEFPFGKIKELPNLPAKVTNEKAADILRDHGIKDVEDVLQMTVQDCVGRIVTFQGVQLHVEGVQTKALTATAISILEVVKKQAVLEQIGSTLHQFDEGRPQGLEVLEWLDEVQCSHLRFTLAEKGLDSLSLVSELTYEDVEKLFAQHELVFEGPPANMGDLKSFYRAVSALKSDVRAQSLKQRLELFRESNEDLMSVFFAQTYCCLEMSLFTITKCLHLVFLGFAMMVFGIACLCIPTGIWPVDIAACTMFGLFGVLMLEEAIFLHRRSRQTAAFVHFIVIPCYNMCMWIGEVIVMFAYDLDKDFLSPEYGWLRRTRCAYFFFTGISLLVVTFHFPQHHYTVLFYVSNVLGMAFFITVCSLDGMLVIIIIGCVCCLLPLGILVMINVKRNQAYKKITYTMVEDMKKYQVKWEIILASKEGKQCLKELASYTEKVKKELKLERALLKKTWTLPFGLKMPSDPAFWIGGSWLPKGPLTRQGKIRQSTRDLDQLFALAKEVHYHLQEKIAELCKVSDTKSDTVVQGKHVPGPVKHPKRAIEKAVRVYNRDCAALCDLVRCTVIFATVQDILEFVKKILRRSQVTDCEDAPRLSATILKETEEEHKRQERWLRLTDIKDRFDPKDDGKSSMGYRDLSIKFEVGWVKHEVGIEFLPVCKWAGRKDGSRTKRLICEMQVHLEDFKNIATGGHAHYCNYRDMLGS